MAYDPSKPQPNDLLSVSQGDIQGNFQTANTVMDVNHYPFDNLTANQGKHKFVQLPALGAQAPAISGEGSLYSITAGSNTNLFYTSDGTTGQFQLTRAIPASIGSFAQSNGWSFLAGAILIQWGTATGSDNSVITFPTAFTSGVYSVQATIYQPTTNRHFLYVQSSTLNNFTITSTDSSGSSESNTFTWLAIGV